MALCADAKWNIDCQSGHPISKAYNTNNKGPSAKHSPKKSAPNS